MAQQVEVLAPPNMQSSDGWVAILLRFAREKPLGAAGALLVLAMILVAILSPWLAPADPVRTHVRDALASPSGQYLLGSDELGRDSLSRIIYGARVSMLVGFLATLLGTVVGTLLNVFSAYKGGWVDILVQRVMDVLLAFPTLIMALAIMAVLGPSLRNVIIAISIPFIPRAGRVVRAAALAVKEQQYIEAARAVGASQWRIIFLHVLPNCMAPYIIVATAFLGTAILVEASLSFLGLGIPPPPLPGAGLWPNPWSFLTPHPGWPSSPASP